MSPERLWRLSIALRRRRLRWLAKRVKQLNSMVYHNSLATGADVADDVYLGHHGLGVVVHDNITIGRGVKDLAERDARGSRLRRLAASPHD